MWIQEWLLNGWPQENWELVIDAIMEWQIVLEERYKEEMKEESKYQKNGKKTQIIVDVYETMVLGMLSKISGFKLINC